MKCGGAISGGAVLSAPPSRPQIQRPSWIIVIAVFHFVLDPILAFAGGMLIIGDRSRPGDPTDVGLGTVVLLAAVFGIVGAVGLLQLKAYGRTIQIALSIVGLLLFPIGTVINGLVLWYLFTPEVRALYSGQRSGKLSAQLPTQEALSMLRTGASLAPVAIVVVIACLAAIGIVGILASIAVPNVVTAMQRSKQKRTMADMRSIATSIEQYVTDNKRLPEAGDIDALKNQVAQYADVVSSDGWAQQIRYGTDGESYWLISAGKDARIETEDPREFPSGTTTNFDCDIVFVNGKFVQYPEGTER